METETAKKILQDKNVQEFVKHITSKMNSLDKVNDISADDPVQIAVEVKARKLAYKKLEDILEPLLNTKRSDNFSNQEYIV